MTLPVYADSLSRRLFYLLLSNTIFQDLDLYPIIQRQLDSVFLVIICRGFHPFPSRTRPLSPEQPMVVGR